MSVTAISHLPENLVDISCFELLSDEILLKIFLFIIESSYFHESKTAYFYGQLTSRRFKRVFSDPQILAALLEKEHSLPLSMIRRLPSDGLYIPLLKRTYEHLLQDFLKSGYISDALPFLESLKEEERVQITYVSLFLLKGPYFNKNGIIEIRNIHAWIKDLSHFFELLPQLQTIRLPFQLSQCSYLFSTLSAFSKQIMGIEMHAFKGSITHTVKYFPKLQSISIADCALFNNESLQLIFSSRPTIIELTLLDTPNICLEDLNIPDTTSLKKMTLRGDNFTNQTTLFLLKRFPDLESLNIASTHNDEEAIETILKSSLQLKELDLSYLPVKDIHFLQVSSSLSRNLRIVKLYGCPFITHKGIEYVKRTFPYLEHLDIRYCGSD